MKNILVVGGAGYIGSHMVWLLGQRGADVVTLDNLSAGHRDAVLHGELVVGDMADCAVLDRVLSSRRFDAVMQEIWSMQPRFEARTGRKPFRLLTHPRFRAAYDFLQLRCESGELAMEVGLWWKNFIAGDPGEREKMLTAPSPGKKKRRRRRKKTASAAPETSNQETG